jgi:hypothetical protein
LLVPGHAPPVSWPSTTPRLPLAPCQRRGRVPAFARPWKYGSTLRTRVGINGHLMPTVSSTAPKIDRARHTRPRDMLRPGSAVRTPQPPTQGFHRELEPASICQHGIPKAYGPSLSNRGRGGWGFAVYRMDVGTPPSKLENQARDRCPEAHCPGVQSPRVQCPDFSSGVS